MARHRLAKYEALRVENRELQDRLAAWEAWGDAVYNLWHDTPHYDMPEELGAIVAAKPDLLE